ERITRTYDRLSVMFTAAIVDISPDRTEMRYSCGAHPGPLLVRANEVLELDEGGPFIGAVANQRYPEWDAELGNWRGVTVITDGVVEARNSNGEQFGDHRLRDVLSEARPGAPIADRVMSRLDAYLGVSQPTDDITLLAIRPTAQERS